MSVEWGNFVDIVKRNKRFVLTSHIRPDCDALGSELGMAKSWIRSANKFAS